MTQMAELAELVAPEHTAIVTQECQGAVIGPNAGLAQLAEEARRVAAAHILSQDVLEFLLRFVLSPL